MSQQNCFDHLNGTINSIAQQHHLAQSHPIHSQHFQSLSSHMITSNLQRNQSSYDSASKEKTLRLNSGSVMNADNGRNSSTANSLIDAFRRTQSARFSSNQQQQVKFCDSFQLSILDTDAFFFILIGKEDGIEYLQHL